MMNKDFDLKTFLVENKTLVENRLKKLLNSSIRQSLLLKAMEYSLLAGEKGCVLYCALHLQECLINII